MRNGLVEGVSLRAILRESGAMAPEAAASVLAGMLLTLAGVHGDVRPENVLVDGTGGLTMTGFTAEPPDFIPEEPTYLAPERLTAPEATAAADVFAATAVFFECLTAEPPFRAATPEDLNALHEYTEIIAEFAPDELRPLIQRGLAKEPADRPQSGHAFLEEVEATVAAAYGADWQARGRALLGGWATAAAAVEGAELAAPDEMPEPPPVGEPIDERLLGLGVEDVEAEESSEPVAAASEAAEVGDELPEADLAASTEVGAELAEAGPGEPDAGTDVLAADLSAELPEADADSDAAAADGIDTDDLLSAFDELAPHSEPVEEPVAESAEPEPEPADPPATTLLLESVTAETTNLAVTPAEREPLVSPSVQADIDHDWVIPSKSSAGTRPLSAYANSLPSLPRPTAQPDPEPEVPAEPVATSAPDDWFRPGVAGPVDRGPRPTRATAVIDPDRENTTVAASFDDGFDEPDDPEDEPGVDPGGPRRKTLVGAVTAAVLLVAGAAAVVLGESGKSGPAPAAQSSTGVGVTTPSASDPSSGTPSPSDLSPTPTGGVPSSRHSSSHSTSKSKSSSSSSAPSSSSASSSDTSSSHSSSSSPSPSSSSSSSEASTPSSSKSSSSSPSTPPSSGHSSSSSKPPNGG